MKKIRLLLVVILSLCILTACTDVTKENNPQPLEEYFSHMGIGLGYNWSNSADSQILTTHNGMFFRRMLESIYQLENGEIPHTDWRVPLDFYMEIALEHFPWDEETVKTAITAGGNYNPDDNTVSLTDGLGNIREDFIVSTETEGNIVKITYQSGTSTYNAKTDKYELLEGDYTTAVLTVEKTENGYVFLSNENAYIDFVNTKHLQRHIDAMSKTMIYQWDENGGELLENPEYLKATLEGLYGQMVYAAYPFPQTNGRARVDTYLSVAGKYLPFDENTVSKLIRSCDSYDAEWDTVAVSAVYEDMSPAHIIKLEPLRDGFVVTYKKETGRFTEGVLTVKNTPDGYYMFTSNRIVK